MRAIFPLFCAAFFGLPAMAQVTDAKREALSAAMAQVGCEVTDDKAGETVMAMTGMDDAQLTEVVGDMLDSGDLVPMFDGIKLVTGPCE